MLGQIIVSVVGIGLPVVSGILLSPKRDVGLSMPLRHYLDYLLVVVSAVQTWTSPGLHTTDIGSRPRFRAS